MNSSEKVVKRSFRISKHGFEGLEQIAKERNVNCNTIVRELVDQYVDYEYVCTKIKICNVDMTVLRFMADQVPKEKLIAFAKDYARTIEGGLNLGASKDHSFEYVMNSLRIFCKYNSMKLIETTHDSKKIAIIIHDAGLNWSEFNANYYKTLFESAGVATDYSVDENAVVLKFQ
jgi:predicted DNA-binding ribbon-helix-helix protein